jgi:hypothetical protein
MIRRYSWCMGFEVLNFETSTGLIEFIRSIDLITKMARVNPV